MPGLLRLWEEGPGQEEEEGMIPRICANCAHGTNVGDAEQIIGTVCKATPLTLWKAPGEGCGGFSMAEAPAYVVPDEPAHAVQETPQEEGDEA